MNINELEKLKKGKNRIAITLIVVLIITVIISVIAAIYYSDMSHTSNPIYLLVLVGIIFFLLGAIKWYDSYYTKKYKRILLPETIKRILPDAVFKEKYKDIAQSVVGKIIKRGTSYEVGDYICGNYNGTRIEISELNVYKVVYSDDHNQIDYFNGVWFVFDFKKNFQGNILIYTKFYPYIKQFGKKIETENITFNECFDIYTDSENNQDLFYILTPNLMELMLKVFTSFRCGIIFYFNENKLYIGIDRKFNFFEPVNGKNINPEEYYKKVKDELESVFILIDSFNK